MIYYRQKVLLALLDALGGSVPATDFQKHLFMFTTLCEREKSYDFVPYKFGCYSFQASADKKKLIEKGYLADIKGWELEKPELNFSNGLKNGDANKLQLFVERYGKMKGKDLIRHVYKSYPFYAINSEIAGEYLSVDELIEIEKARPEATEATLFATIGYEGGSIESYVNRLIKTDVRLLVDVRKNPISRKYGFSKRTLSSLLGRLGIEYTHIPELGIESTDRQQLENQSDYDRLFDKYESTVLVKQNKALEQLYQLLKTEQRIAITCFEKEHHQCHRSRVANAIESLSNNEVKSVHL